MAGYSSAYRPILCSLPIRKRSTTELARGFISVSIVPPLSNIGIAHISQSSPIMRILPGSITSSEARDASSAFLSTR